MSENDQGRKLVGVVRDSKGRVTKSGANLNPAGKNASGLAARIRELTNDGQSLIEVLQKIAVGEIQGKAADKIHAAEILLSRAYGKPVDIAVTAQLETATREHAPAAQLTVDQLEAIASGQIPQILPSSRQDLQQPDPLEDAILVDSQGNRDS